MSLTARNGWTVFCASLLAAVALAGCATGGAGAGGGGRSPTLMSAQPSGGPELVGTASLPLGGAAPSVALATALVLDAFAWPVVSVDTAQGAMVSDWQYFEPAVRASAGEGFCQNPMALRFLVRAFDSRFAQITAEAYVPRSRRSAGSSGWSDSLEPTADPLRRQALTEARAALAALRKAVAATGGAQDTEERAMTDLGRQLDSGDFHRCADGTR